MAAINTEKQNSVAPLALQISIPEAGLCWRSLSRAFPGLFPAPARAQSRREPGDPHTSPGMDSSRGHGFVPQVNPALLVPPKALPKSNPALSASLSLSPAKFQLHCHPVNTAREALPGSRPATSNILEPRREWEPAWQPPRANLLPFFGAPQVFM